MLKGQPSACHGVAAGAHRLLQPPLETRTRRRPRTPPSELPVSLTLAPLLLDAGLDPAQTLVIRHAFVTEPEQSGLMGLHADS